ncbi:MAG: hypothetical protein D6729_01285 [Deltaproteobacteria bacterium]|nr:MAG: hypothetical protein D6729_01285 [Deltaproteobacteria bacterium]
MAKTLPSGGGPAALPPKPARLSVNAFPYAQVTLEGGRVLGTTPIRAAVLPPGTYVLVLRNPELGLERKATVTLAPGEEKTLGLRLDR